MKWISAKKKENLDAADISQTNITDRKTFRHNVFYWKIGQREKRPFWDSGAGVGAKKSKLIKMGSRFISRGLIDPIREKY